VGGVSYELTKLVLRNCQEPTLPPKHRLVLAVLASYATGGKSGEADTWDDCRPSFDSIARAAGIGRSTALRMVNDLTNHNVISRSESRNKLGHKYLTYKFNAAVFTLDRGYLAASKPGAYSAAWTPWEKPVGHSGLIPGLHLKGPTPDPSNADPVSESDTMGGPTPGTGHVSDTGLAVCPTPERDYISSKSAANTPHRSAVNRRPRRATDS
jgi:hypothetical protein